MRSALLLLALCACATKPVSVNVAGGWPDRPLRYDDAHARWTRRAQASADFEQVIDAAATLKSPEWRAAYAAERARRFALPPAEADKLATEERAASEVWEVELLMATGRAAWNDLHKPARSIWRVALAGDEGREVVPTSVHEDKRPRAVLAQYYPDITPFHKAYVVTFPKTTPDGAPLVTGDASRLVLKVSSPMARVELSWGREGTTHRRRSNASIPRTCPLPRRTPMSSSRRETGSYSSPARSRRMLRATSSVPVTWRPRPARRLPTSAALSLPAVPGRNR